MLAIKINDPYIEKELTNMAKKQHISRQAVVRSMITKQLEDAEDYAAAAAAKHRLESGESTTISAGEMWRRLGLDD